MNKTELQQKIVNMEKHQHAADIEAKLAQAQKTIEIQRMSNDALIDENLDYRYDITDTAYERAKEMAKSWEEDCQQEIAQLKQQLAESKEELKNAYREGLAQKQFDKDAEIMLLKQQLAEKEKEIEQLKKFDNLNKTFFDLFRTAFREPNKVDDLFNTLKTMQEKQDQSKTEFAIQQLEKLRHYIWTNQQDDGWLDESVDIYSLSETIDQIIKELEGETK